jgi:hypothetical protein
MAMGGVGEAMLLGAAMGGGTSALMGRDPLKGALIGGLTGGAGAGVSSALNATTPAVEGALLSGGADAAAGAGIDSISKEFIANNPSLYPSGYNLPGNATMFTGTSTPGVTSTIPSAAPAENFAYNPVTRANDIIPNTVTSAPTPNAYTIPSPGSNVVPTGSTGPQTFTEGMKKFADNPMDSLKRNPFTAVGSSLAAINATRPEDYIPPEYRMKGLRFSDNYRAAYAEGGIASLGAEGYDRMVGEQPMYQAMASGGISSLGSYSDGGRMLKGPGDGMSDDIPATIANKRPARLARDEFVVPADVVSHLGNGSSDAGAKQLYAMMDRVRQARTGRKSQGREINPRKYTAA